MPTSSADSTNRNNEQHERVGHKVNEPLVLVMGSPVYANEDSCGELARVVVQRRTGIATHLIVGPSSEGHHQHLVPLELVERANSEIWLRCTKAEFEQLDYEAETSLEHVDFPDPLDPYDIFWPNASADRWPGQWRFVNVKHIPTGEVEIQAGEPVRATDGRIGKTRGVVVDPLDHRLTHLLLEEGHIANTKEVAVPFAIVTDIDERGAEVGVTREQVRELRPVDVAQFTL